MHIHIYKDSVLKDKNNDTTEKIQVNQYKLLYIVYNEC